MNTNGVLNGKKIFLMTDDGTVAENVQKSLAAHGAVLFHDSTPKEAIGNALAKNPDLLIYDERMPAYHGLKPLSVIKRARPKSKVLFLARNGTPLRSMDATAQGVSFTIQSDSSPQQIYNAVKHCLAIASVPRIEAMAE
ncbi:MAG: response regulator [Candidatus Omnitrophota bacterium]